MRGLTKIVFILIGAALSLEARAVKINDNFDVTGWVWAMYREETTVGNGALNKRGLDVDEAEFDFNYKYDQDWDVMMSFIVGRWAGFYTPSASSTSTSTAGTTTTTTALTGSDNQPATVMLRRGFIRGKNMLHEGSYTIFGQQGNPYMSRVEAKWGMNWLDGYTIYLQDGGFTNRWEQGLTLGGDLGKFQYDLFYHTGNGFDGNGLKQDNTMNYTAMFGYQIMEGFSAHATYMLAGDNSRTNRKGVSTAGLAVMYKTNSYYDFLLEYAMMTGACSTAASGGTAACSGFTGSPRAPAAWVNSNGSNDLSLSAAGYAVHLNSHLTEKWGAWIRFVSGNTDFTDRIGGVNYGQWGPSKANGSDSVLSRVSVGPTYVFVKDKVFGAAIYEMGTLSNNSPSKNLTTNAITSYNALRFNVAAFF